MSAPRRFRANEASISQPPQLRPDQIKQWIQQTAIKPRSKKKCLLLASYPQNQHLDKTVVAEMVDDYEDANLIMALCSGEASCDSPSEKEQTLRQVLKELSVPEKLPDGGKRQVFVVLLTQFYDQYKKYPNFKQLANALLSAYLEEDKQSTSNGIGNNVCCRLMTLLRVFQKMWKEGVRQPGAAGFLPVFQHYPITDFSALEAFWDFTQILLQIVRLLPPAMQRNCLLYFAINPTSKNLAASYLFDMFTDADKERLETISSEITAVLKQHEDADVHTVIWISSILKRRLIPDLGVENAMSNPAQSNPITKELVEALEKASKGDVRLKDFGQQIYTCYENIKSRLTNMAVRFLFPKCQLDGDILQKPEGVCNDPAHRNFRMAVLNDCNICALKYLEKKDIKLSIAILLKLLEKHHDKLTTEIAQLLCSMDIIDCDTPQKAALIETLKEKNYDLKTIQDELERLSGRTSGPGPTSQIVQELSGKEPTPPALDSSTGPAASTEVLKPALEQPPLSIAEALEVSPIVDRAVLGMIAETINQLSRKAADKNTQQDPTDQASLESIPKDEPDDQSLPDEHAWWESCEPKYGGATASDLRGTIKGFLSMLKLPKDQDSPQKPSCNYLDDQLKQLATALEKLTVPADARQQAINDISAVAFQAVSQLKDGIFETETPPENASASNRGDASNATPGRSQKGQPQPVKMTEQERVLLRVKKLFDSIWKIFFELGCVARSEPLYDLSVELIQKHFGPSNQLQLGVELWETFRTVELWIAAWQRNMASKDVIAGSKNSKEFSFVVPVCTDSMLESALRSIPGIEGEKLRDLANRFFERKNELHWDAKVRKVRNMVIRMCIEYAQNQGWLSAEKNRLCEEYLRKYPDDVAGANLSEPSFIDLRSPDVPLRDIVPNWDYMELTLSYKAGVFSFTLCEILQFKARYHMFSQRPEKWQQLGQDDRAGFFQEDIVYRKLKKAFVQYSMLFDENTTLEARAEYLTGVLFDFTCKGETFNPHYPGMTLTTRFRSMYEDEPLPESYRANELKKAYFIDLEQLNQFADCKNTIESMLDFQKSLIGFSGQVMVPILSDGPKDQTFNLTNGSFTLRGWPVEEVVERQRAMLSSPENTNTKAPALEKAADTFLTTRLVRNTEHGVLDDLLHWPLKRIIHEFMHKFVVSDGRSPVDFGFKDTETAFQAFIVRVWAPILIRSKESELYRLFKIGQKGGLPIEDPFFDRFLKTLEHAGDENFDEEARQVMRDAQKRFPNEADYRFAALTQRANESKCDCPKSAKNLRSAVTVGCLKCTALHLFETDTLANNKTDLMVAAMKNYCEIVELLAFKEAGLRSPDGKTAIMHAVEAESLDAVKALIPHEAGLQDAEGKTALAYAIQSGCAEVARLLLPHEEKIADKNKARPADHAMAANYPKVWTLFPNDIGQELAAQLTRAHKARCACQERSRNLMQAAVLGCPRCSARFIAQAGGRIWGHTALMLAAAKGHAAVAQLLVHREGKLADRQGRTALIHAAMHGKADVVSVLAPLEAGARDAKGAAVIHHAAYFGRLEAVEALVGFEAKAQTRAGETALMIAAARGHLGVVQLLSQHEARMQDADGATALMWAAFYGRAQVVEALIPSEAGMETKRGDAAVDFARVGGHADLVKILAKLEAAE